MRSERLKHHFKARRSRIVRRLRRPPGALPLMVAEVPTSPGPYSHNDDKHQHHGGCQLPSPARNLTPFAEW